jgi:AcrR family transcriptional regulator
VPRAGLTPDKVVGAAGTLADELGYERLTLAALAERLGVRQPSLYKHVDSLDALRRGVSLQAKRELGDVLARATVGRSGPDAVRALADAYRGWVLAHPGRYAATVRAPDPDDEDDQRAGGEVLQVLLDVLAGFGLRGATAVDAARTLRSALHGFVHLESLGGFGLPREVGRSYRFLVDTLVDGFAKT